MMGASSALCVRCSTKRGASGAGGPVKLITILYLEWQDSLLYFCLLRPLSGTWPD